MIMIKKNIQILFLITFLISNDNNVFRVNQNSIKVEKKQYNGLFKQARALEKNGLFNEAKLIYKNILLEDPTNKIAFNKIKVILKNEENFNLLKEIAENYQINQPNNPMAKIDLLEVYLFSNDDKFQIIADEILIKHLKTDFIIKLLLNRLLEFNEITLVDKIIDLKRMEKNKQDFYSFEMGNYYISRLNYENAIVQFLFFLNKNPDQYTKVSSKILSIPNYLDLQDKITDILYDSKLKCSKILLSDIAFKGKNYRLSYNLLIDNFEEPEQLLDFAYQNKKIENYDLAIEVCQYVINQNYNARLTTLAILEMGDILEKQSIKSEFDMPISKYFYNNQILTPHYNYLDKNNLNTLNGAISLYDSLYSISKGSDAGFRLAEIKFTMLNDLDAAFDIYSDCIKHSKNTSIRFNSALRLIDIMISKGDLISAKKILNESYDKYKNENQKHLLAVKNMQIDFFKAEISIMDSIANIVTRIPKDDFLYNDLLDMQSIILSFQDNFELLKKFSNVQLLIFQNKKNEAISILKQMHTMIENNVILKDFIIYQLSYLLLINNSLDDALDYLAQISHETIFAEFSYILNAEIFDFIINDKKNAVDLYLDFLNRYPLSIFYDDIRIRLRDLAS